MYRANGVCRLLEVTWRIEKREREQEDRTEDVQRMTT